MNKLFLSFLSSTDLSISPVWHYRALQISFRVVNRIAFAFPVSEIDKFLF
ncbi:hypothetical protein IC171_00340 [Clostridioides sp. ES-S-0171-01]|nr:hypothetical protein [Clostridioides sp. ES-S-0171-01]